jgi:hypothetical protein
VDFVLVPVIGEALDDDAILLHPLDEFERPGADRMIGEIGAGLLRRGRRHHHAAVGKRPHQRHERRLEVDPDRRVVQHVGALDGADLALPAGAREGQVALEIELHRLGVERRPVLEPHAFAQLEGDRPIVRRPGIAQRQLRHEIERRVGIEQLVAHRRQCDPPDEGAAERRVERIGILAEPDPQGLGIGGGADQRHDETKQSYRSHDPLIPE